MASSITRRGQTEGMGAKTYAPQISRRDLMSFFNGIFLESFDALVTSDGATVTLTLTNDVSGNLTMVFSDGQTIFDLSGSDGVVPLTAGSNRFPTKNFVYILQSDKILTVSTTGWPTTEHIGIGFFFVPSAGRAQTHGVYVNHNMNDHASDQATSLGHLSHITERIRAQSAIYKTGAALTVTPSSGGTVVDVAVTAGVVYQMHKHATPALNTATGDTVFVVNQNGAEYDDVHDLETLTNDSTGTAVKKYFNWVFWGTANKEGEFAPLMLNLPNGSYNKLASAIADTSGFDVLTMPAAFNVDSTTGFLNSRVTMSLSGGVFAVENTVDLRGSTPQSVVGGGIGGQETEFADNQFKLFDDGDATKVLAFQLSGISTATTRTITMADKDIDLANVLLADGTVPLTAPWAANNDITGLTKLEVDNIRINLNTIEAISGNLTLKPAGGSNITLSGAARISLTSDDVRIVPGLNTDASLIFTGTSNSGTLLYMEDEDEFRFDALVQATQLKSTGTLQVDGVGTIAGIGDGGLTSYDLKVGDVTTPDYGMIRFGNAVIGRTSYKAGSIDLDGAILIRNMGGPVTSEIEHIFTESTGNTCRFALPKSGVGNATYNPRSMLIAGPAPADTDFVKVSYWKGQGIFDNLVCDTAGDGADLGVQNDLEVEGDIFTDSLRESTSGAGISITHAGTVKANTDFLKLINEANAADMDGTATSILFRQAYLTGAVVDMGRLKFEAAADWTSTASTQDTVFRIEMARDGVMVEKFRIDSSLVFTGGNMFVLRDGSFPSQFLYSNSDNDTHNARLNMRKSGGTFASPTAVVNGERIGQFEYGGYDGSAYHTRASVFVDVDGIVVDISNTVPMALSFRTGTTSATTERLTIDSSGDIFFKTTGVRVQWGTSGNEYIEHGGAGELEYHTNAGVGHRFRVNSVTQAEIDAGEIRLMNGGSERGALKWTAGTVSLYESTTEHVRFGAGDSSFAGQMMIASTISAPAASAILELSSTTGAFLPSRMTTTQRDALTALNGMMLYNTTTGAMNYRKAGAWVAI